MCIRLRSRSFALTLRFRLIFCTWVGLRALTLDLLYLFFLVGSCCWRSPAESSGILLLVRFLPAEFWMRLNWDMSKMILAVRSEGRNWANGRHATWPLNLGGPLGSGGRAPPAAIENSSSYQRLPPFLVGGVGRLRLSFSLPIQRLATGGKGITRAVRICIRGYILFWSTWETRWIIVFCYEKMDLAL